MDQMGHRGHVGCEVIGVIRGHMSYVICHMGQKGSQVTGLIGVIGHRVISLIGMSDWCCIRRQMRDLERERGSLKSGGTSPRADAAAARRADAGARKRTQRDAGPRSSLGRKGWLLIGLGIEVHL